MRNIYSNRLDNRQLVIFSARFEFTACACLERDIDKPDVPFVTIEYSLKQNKVLQCYGICDSKPDEAVLDFVNKKWLPYANRKLKQINKAA